MAPERCAALRAAFGAEVRPHRGRLLRQASTREEPHRISSAGLVTNGILGFQDYEDRFPEFCRLGLGVVTDRGLREWLEAELGDDPLCVETMYFESALGTGTHADRHYMDSADRGTMIGVRVALEEIDEGAGRFFVYPHSHRLGTGDPAFAAVAEAYAEYEALSFATVGAFQATDAAVNAVETRRGMQLVESILASAGLTAWAPALAPGDAVAWSARTLHGSYRPTVRDRSRHSVTAHYVRASRPFLRYERPCVPPVVDVDGMRVSYHAPSAPGA